MLRPRFTMLPRQRVQRANGRATTERNQGARVVRDARCNSPTTSGGSQSPHAGSPLEATSGTHWALLPSHWREPRRGNVGKGARGCMGVWAAKPAPPRSRVSPRCGRHARLGSRGRWARVSRPSANPRAAPGPCGPDRGRSVHMLLWAGRCLHSAVARAATATAKGGCEWWRGDMWGIGSIIGKCDSPL